MYKPSRLILFLLITGSAIYAFLWILVGVLKGINYYLERWL
jgi:hypothetical protein